MPGIQPQGISAWAAMRVSLSRKPRRGNQSGVYFTIAVKSLMMPFSKPYPK